MKTINEVDNILAEMPTGDFIEICDLMDACYKTNYSADAEQKLTKAVIPYGLTTEEVLAWDAK